MEVSTPPQSVQINFNNKIITLHNVTILKNPKIITIDATQYSNFLKGSPVKLVNGSTTTTPVKIQMPTLVPMRTEVKPIQTPVIRAPTLPVPSYQQQIKLQQPSVIITPPKLTSAAAPTFVIAKSPVTPTKVIVKPKIPLPEPLKVEVPPAINSAPGVKTNLEVKLAPEVKFPTGVKSTSGTKSTSNIKSNQEVNSNTEVKLNPGVKPTSKIKSNEGFKLNSGFKSTSKIKSNLEVKSTSEVKLNPEVKLNQEVKSTQEVKLNPGINSAPLIISAPPINSVIISPPQKNKVSPCQISPPEAKRQCKKVDFHCIFCKNSYEDSSLLIEHMKDEHSAKIPKVEAEERKAEIEVKKEPDQETPSKDLEEETSEDEDESEVNDLIMDLEETTQDSIQSPEFEQHIPMTFVKQEEVEPEQEDLDCEDYEYFSNIMEPICELSCEDDSNDGVQNENEAMRLYREAMEVNYMQNGIKKRGRRKQRKPKPLVESSLNGILAGLLENTTVKVPVGPGRGRRKEMNEMELEIERSNGQCLFSCNKCDETFKYAGDLAKHVRSHTISSPYQCTICQRKFTHIGSLNTHLRIHSGERPYKCNQCDKSFTQSNSLMVHVKSHLSNKPFQCIQCNKGFINASSLALHQKTHTGTAETVTCPIEDCGKEFRDNNLLEEHMMTHRHSMLYQCSLCSEKFEQSCLLVQHVKQHIGEKPFQCNQCGKCFTQPGSLNTHLRIHTGEKPFKCEICGKNFTQASSLSVHMKVHGEKEFKCVVENCKKSFGQENTLRKHMLKHIASMNDENSQQIKQE